MRGWVVGDARKDLRPTRCRELLGGPPREEEIECDGAREEDEGSDQLAFRCRTRVK